MAIKILGVIGCFGRVAVPKTRLRPLLVSETSKQVKQSDHGKGVRLIVNADCLLVCLLVSFFCFLQGGAAFSALTGHFTDPELSSLASCLPSRCLGAKADSTTERYSRAFDKFRLWAASYKEISVLPSNFLTVAIYLEFLLQSNFSYSALEAALYGIHGHIIFTGSLILVTLILLKAFLNRPREVSLDQ